MAQTPNIQASQAETSVVYKYTTAGINVPQAQTILTYNIPTHNINMAQVVLESIFNKDASYISCSQAKVLVVGKGSVDNPKLKAWTYTLDGHDYYVLKLGTDSQTIVFDLTTGQSAWWSWDGKDHWRTSVGLNWRSSGNIPFNYGSNVICGDDSTGILWVLDPMQGVDDGIATDDPVTFERVAVGQMITRDRQFIPVYSVDLTASLGDPSLTADNFSLSYSDDQGHTFLTADAPQATTAGNYEQYMTWRSLGLIRSPGRLFKITDNGAFARIDGLDVNLGKS